MKNLFFTVFTLLALCGKSQTQFGTAVSFPSTYQSTSNDFIDVANQLGAKCMRQTIIMQEWDGTSNRFDQYEAAGLKVILNINYGDPAVAPLPFIKDTVAYKAQLSTILDTHHPEVVVIENEELADLYHTGPISDYINELSAAIGVCHSKGLTVTNAGLLATPLCILIYNDYLSRGLTAEAADFKTRTFNSNMSYYIAHPNVASDLATKVHNCDTLIAAFAGLNLDYINFHLEETLNLNLNSDGQSATPKVYQEIVDYLTRVTGKPVMTNETAETNLSPSLVTSMLTEYKKTGIKYVIWYSGDGVNPIIPDSALHNPDGSLRLNGIAYSNFMANKTVDLSKAGLFASPVSGFDTLCINSTSPYKLFTLIGSSLNGSTVTIGPMAGFSFSTSDTGTYTPSLTVSGYGKSFTRAVYIQYVPASLGSINKNIPIKGGGVTAINLPVTATVINSSPVLSAKVTSISCYGNINDGTVDLAATGGTGALTYSWTSVDLPFFKSSAEDLTNLKPANYTVEVTSQAGCKIAATYAVIEPDKLDIIVTADSNIVCKNGTTTVTVAATGGTLPYNGTGVFTVNYGTYPYTVTDARGCNKTENFFVANGTDGGPSKPSSITGTDADNKGVCGNGNYVYSIAAVSGATSYLWSAPAGITIASYNANGTSATINASSSFSSGSLTVSAKNGCGTSAAQTKTINETPKSPGSITGPGSVLKNKAGLIYSVSPIIPGLTYTWTVNNGAKITAGQNTSSITVTWGTLAGKVTVKAQNNCGLSSGTSRDISVSNLLSPNANSQSASVANTFTNALHDLYAVPNPVKERAYIIFNAESEYSYTLKVTDLSGRLLQIRKGVTLNGENKALLDVHTYTAGMYIVTVEDNKGLKRTMKLVKE